MRHLFLASHWPEIFFPGYVCEQRERTTMEWAGLSILINEGIQYWVRDHLSLLLEGRIETLFIEIKNEGKKIDFGINLQKSVM